MFTLLLSLAACDGGTNNNVFDNDSKVIDNSDDIGTADTGGMRGSIDDTADINNTDDDDTADPRNTSGDHGAHRSRSTPPWICTGDNDGPSPTACFASDWRTGAWIYDASAVRGYVDNDDEYTLAVGARGGWQFQPAPRGGTAEFWVNVPTTNADAKVTYRYTCRGTSTASGVGTVNQAATPGTWVKAGPDLVGVVAGSICTIEIAGMSFPRIGARASMDAVRVVVR